MALAITQVRELRRVTPDALELARGGWCVKCKLRFHLQIRDELRVLHLQELAVAPNFQLTVEPEPFGLHRDVVKLRLQRRFPVPVQAIADRGEILFTPALAHTCSSESS